MKNADKPAMPCTKEETKWNRGGGRAFSETVKIEELGLTKREMFAMHSMQAILSGNSLRELGDIAKENGLNNADSLIVEMSISAADALLAELDK